MGDRRLGGIGGKAGRSVIEDLAGRVDDSDPDLGVAALPAWTWTPRRPAPPLSPRAASAGADLRPLRRRSSTIKAAADLADRSATHPGRRRQARPPSRLFAQPGRSGAARRPGEGRGRQRRIATLPQSGPNSTSERSQRPRHQHPAHPGRWPGHRLLLLRQQEGRRSPTTAGVMPTSTPRSAPICEDVNRGRHNANVGIFVKADLADAGAFERRLEPFQAASGLSASRRAGARTRGPRRPGSSRSGTAARAPG